MYMFFILQVSCYFCYDKNFHNQKLNSLGDCGEEKSVSPRQTLPMRLERLLKAAFGPSPKLTWW